MDVMKEEAKLTLWTYIQNGIHSPATWWIPLSVVCAIAILAVAFSFAISRQKQTATYRSLTALYYAGLSVIVLSFFATIGAMKFTELLSSGNYQLGIIVGLVVVYVFTFTMYWRLCSQGAKTNTLLMGMPLTPRDRADKMNAHKGRMTVLCLMSIATAMPFLLLLLDTTRSYLVSVVFDNSGSMEEYSYFNDSRIAFSNIVTNRSSKSDFVLTYFADSEDFLKSFDTIVATQEPGALHTVTNHYDNKSDFLGDLNTLSPVTKSPIIEGVWQNFLVAQRLAEKQYDAKKLIVITDGQDELYWSMNLQKSYVSQQDETGKDGVLIKKGSHVKKPIERIDKDIFAQKGKSGMTVAEFYNDEIYVITWTDDYDDHYLVADCANSITKLDGSDTRSYYRSLKEDVLPEMFFDKLLLYILIGFACALPIGLYIIKTSKI